MAGSWAAGDSRFWHGRTVAEGAVGPDGVAVAAPLLDQDLRLAEREDDPAIGTLPIGPRAPTFSGPGAYGKPSAVRSAEWRRSGLNQLSAHSKAALQEKNGPFVHTNEPTV